eukprot:3422261-Rhodomonas_salina.2
MLQVDPIRWPRSQILARSSFQKRGQGIQDPFRLGVRAPDNSSDRDQRLQNGLCLALETLAVVPDQFAVFSVDQELGFGHRPH